MERVRGAGVVERGSAVEGAAGAGAVRREAAWLECDACGSALQTLGHCKYLCRQCGFMRTCMDTV